MATKSINKSQVIRDFREKYPDKKPAELSKLIKDEIGADITPGFISAVKSKQQSSGGRKKKKGKPGPKPKSKTTAAPAAKPSAPAKSNKSDGAAEHIANLRAAAEYFGTEEAKRILGLF